MAFGCTQIKCPFVPAFLLLVSSQPKGSIPDYDEPVILHAENPTIEEFCNRLHRGLLAEFSHAWVWGRSAKHQPQRCGKEHVLMDEGKDEALCTRTKVVTFNFPNSSKLLSHEDVVTIVKKV